MGKIQEMVEDVLRDRGMVYDTQDKLVLKRHWRGQNVTMDMMAECYEEEGILNVNAVLPVVVPEDEAERVALAFAWLNSEMAFGTFSIEQKGNCVVFGTSQLFDPEKDVDGQLVSNVISAVTGLADRLYERIMRIIWWEGDQNQEVESVRAVLDKEPDGNTADPALAMELDKLLSSLVTNKKYCS